MARVFSQKASAIARKSKNYKEIAMKIRGFDISNSGELA